MSHVYKRRKPLSMVSLFAVIFLAVVAPMLYVFTMRPQSAQAAWFDDVYSYRQKTTVSNSGSAQTDFQVSIAMDTATLITAGKMQSDCDDIRVTDAGGILLSHVIEEGSAPCNNAATKIWVKIPSIPTTNQVLYLYYGNPAATSAENGKAVFDFFDNFSTAQSAWTATGATSMSGGALTITTGAVYSNATILASSTSYMYEYRAQWSATVANYAGMMIDNTQSSAASNSEGDKLIYIMSNGSSSIAQRGWANDTGTGYNLANNMTLYTPTAATYYVDGFSMDSSQIKFWNNGSQVGTTVTGTWTGAPAPYLWLGYFTGSAAGTTNITDITVDWVRVRKYAATAPSASTAGSETQGPGPISYWGFDEGQGSTANDWNQGSDNDLTITNAAWKTSDLCVFGNCLYFDGSTDYAKKSYSSDTELLPGTGSFTVSGWLKHSSTAGADTAISRVDAVAGIGWKVYMNSSGNLCFGIDAVAGTFPNDSACSTVSYADSTWHFVTAIKSGTTSITLFIDGLQVKQTTGITGTTLDGTNAPFIVGNDFDGGTNGWDGFIDEVKYYNFAKTNQEVITEFASKGAPKGSAASFGAGDAAHSLSQGLVGYWKLDESSGNATDSSGNALTLTNNGVTTFVGGKFGNSSNHNGTTQYFSTATTISGVQTVAFWVNPASTSDDYTNLIASTAYINSSSGTISATGFTTPSIYVNGVLNGTLTASVWNHVVVTTGTAISATAFEAGRANGAYLDNTGKLDEVRLYNRALTGSEVEVLYNFAPGPVGWWKMDEANWAAPNCSATVTTDSSGNGYGLRACPATTGPTGGTTGKFGNSVTVDGTEDYLESTNTGLGIAGEITMTAWININAIGGGGDKYIIDRTNNNLGYALVHDTSTAHVKMRIGDGTTYQTLTGATVLSTSTWYHFAATFDASGNMRVYLNGNLDNSTTIAGSLTAATANFRIGARSTNTYFNGSIDDVRVYNYARTPKQIVEDMNAGHPTGGSPVGSQAVYWNFDEGQGTTANNSGTASSSNGTLTSIASPATATSGWTFTGKVNKGIIFDGTNDNVVIATANDAAVDFATTEPFSASAWVYVTTMPGSGNQDAIIAKWDETGNLAAYKLYVENDDADATGNFEVQIYDESASQAITASQVIDQVAVNTWYHVAFTFNGGVAGAAGDLKLYVNGNLTAQNAANTLFLGLEDKASDFTVGDYDAGDAVANNTAFTGTIDEVKVYSGLLTQSEIQVDMNAGSAAALGGVLGSHDDEGFSLPVPLGWWKMDENTGTSSTVDSSGNGYDAPMANFEAWDWTAGKLGSALDFDGTSEYLGNISTSVSIANLNTYSLTGWFKDDSSTSTETYIYAEKNTANNDTQFLVLQMDDNGTAGQLGWSHKADNATRADVIDTGLNDNKWHFFAVIRRASNSFELWVDGILKSTDTDAPGTTTINNIKIGASQRLSGIEKWFNGLIDDVRVYQSALSIAEIQYLYNRGAPVGHWEFDECQGATAYNSALNANNEAAGMNGTITPGASGNTTVGSCGSGISTEMWNNGTTGKFGASLDFDGTDDYVQVTGTSTLRITGDLTFGAWFNASVIGDANVTIYMGGDVTSETAANNQLYKFRWNTNSGNDIRYVHESGAGTDNEITWDTNLSTSTWYHAVFVRDTTANTVTLYVNGVSYGAQSYTSDPTDGTSANLFFATRDPGGNRYNGLLDDVRIYNYAMTAGQIQRLYNEGFAQRFGPATGSP